LHDRGGHSAVLEKVEAIYEADLEDTIREMDLQEFGGEKEEKTLRKSLLR
jgi:hypothetical protein